MDASTEPEPIFNLHDNDTEEAEAVFYVPDYDLEADDIDQDSLFADPQGSSDSSFLQEDWDIRSVASTNNAYIYNPVPQFLRPVPNDPRILFEMAAFQYEFIEYYSNEHYLRMKRIEHNNFGPHLPFTMPPVVLPIRGDPVHLLVIYQHDVLPDPMFDHPRHISPGITNFEDIIVMPGFHAYDHDWMQSLE
eukprot:scaffold95558_cov34-Attheya_sp.AAC.1